jgi:hypothetical protein
MHEQHASPEAIRLFLRAELSSRETSVLIRHLLSRCPRCLEAAGALAWTSRSRLHGYEEAFAATERRLADREQELMRQRTEAAVRWQEPRRQPLVRWRWRIRPGGGKSRGSVWRYNASMRQERDR